MSDLVEDKQEVDVEVSEDASKTVEKQAKTNEKVFTQADVNKLIGKERISMQKRHEEELSVKEAALEGLETLMKSAVAEAIKDLPEFEKKLIAKLPLTEQYEILNSPEMKVSKKKIPATQKDEEVSKTSQPERVEKYI